MTTYQDPARTSRRLGGDRRGASAVEAVLVAPLLLVVLLGAIDIGQYVNVAQNISNASRETARFASRSSTSTVAAVEAYAEEYLANAFPSLTTDQVQQAVTVTVYDVSTGVAISNYLTAIPSGGPMSVDLDFDFATVRWLKNIDYWNFEHNGTTTFVRRE
jgi:Flp pilus assembly protein TadG